MGVSAVYVAVSDEQLDDFITKIDHFEAMEELEEKCDYLDIGKLWEGLHFILTGKLEQANNPFSEFVYGKYYVEEEECISYIPKEDFIGILEVVNTFNFDELKNIFNPNEFTRKEVYPNIWCEEDEERLFEELKEYFIELKEFYNKNTEKNIIVSIY